MDSNLVPVHLKQNFYSLSYAGRNINISREAHIVIFLLYSTTDKYLFVKFKNVESKANLSTSFKNTPY